MGIGTGIAVAGSIGGSIAGGALAAHGAGSAAKTQANAAMDAAQLQKQAADESLAFQKEQWQTSQNNLAPWLQAGRGGLANLAYLLGIPMPGAMGQMGTASLGNSGAIGGGGTFPTPGVPNGITAGGQVPDVRQQVLGPDGQPTAPTQVPDPRQFAGGQMSNMAASLGGGEGTNPEIGGGGGGGGVNLGNPGTTSGATNPSDVSSLVNPNLGGFGSLMQGWNKTFQAPNGITEQNDPGFQARLKLGTDALQRSAAARGGVLTGGTAKDLNSFAQDYASNEYGNVYNRAWNDYANQFNTFETNQTNQFNRLASIAGMGQTTANQLGMFGQNAATNIGNTMMNAAGQIGQQYNNAAAANASGQVAGANAWGSVLGNSGNQLSNLLLLQKLGGYI